MSVWASSMNKIVGFGLFLIASITFFSRFSNSPFTDAPACKRPRSSPHRSTFFRWSGTSLAAIRRAMPSTIAVFPTPASPTRMGLFFLRRLKMSRACRISLSRPRIGSIFPSIASLVKLAQNCSSTSLLPLLGPPPAAAKFAFPVCSTDVFVIAWKSFLSVS